jgi:chaperonin GroEL
MPPRDPGEDGEDGSVIVGKIIEKDQYAFGFDAQTREYAPI